MNNDAALLHIAIAGPFACFRRPEFSHNLISYDVMPPLVARRILQTLLPSHDHLLQLRRLQVLRPIKAEWQRVVTKRGPSQALVLVDVAYVLECAWLGVAAERVRLTETLDHGAGAHLGLPTMTASVSLLSSLDIPQADRDRVQDLGWLPLLPASPGQAGVTYMRALMRAGVIDLTGDLITAR